MQNWKYIPTASDGVDRAFMTAEGVHYDDDSVSIRPLEKTNRMPDLFEMKNKAQMDYERAAENAPDFFEWIAELSHILNRDKRGHRLEKSKIEKQVFLDTLAARSSRGVAGYPKVSSDGKIYLSQDSADLITHEIKDEIAYDTKGFEEYQAHKVTGSLLYAYLFAPIKGTTYTFSEVYNVYWQAEEVLNGLFERHPSFSSAYGKSSDGGVGLVIDQFSSTVLTGISSFNEMGDIYKNIVSQQELLEGMFSAYDKYFEESRISPAVLEDIKYFLYINSLYRFMGSRLPSLRSTEIAKIFALVAKSFEISQLKSKKMPILQEYMDSYIKDLNTLTEQELEVVNKFSGYQTDPKYL